MTDLASCWPMVTWPGFHLSILCKHAIWSTHLSICQTGQLLFWLWSIVSMTVCWLIARHAHSCVLLGISGRVWVVWHWIWCFKAACNPHVCVSLVYSPLQWLDFWYSDFPMVRRTSFGGIPIVHLYSVSRRHSFSSYTALCSKASFLLKSSQKNVWQHCTFLSSNQND